MRGGWGVVRSVLPPEHVGAEVPSQSLQRVPHALRLTTDLSDPLAQTRLSVSELDDLGAEADPDLGDPLTDPVGLDEGRLHGRMGLMRHVAGLSAISRGKWRTNLG